MNTIALISLLLTTILILILLFCINRTKSKLQIKEAFVFAIICLLICCTGQLLQIVCSNIHNVKPIYFDYLVYVGTCFLPVAFFFIAIIFEKTKIIITKKYLLLFIIPTLSLIILWTNNYHNWFYKVYSTNFKDTVYGIYFYIHSLYSYILIGISALKIIMCSTKNSSFFSRQSMLLFIGALIPIIINILGTFNIVKMTIYITPISFAFTIIFFALAIFKFDFLKIAPIALQKIVDKISDGYIVLNEDMVITDFNKTFLELFSLHSKELRSLKISDFLNLLEDVEENNESFIAAINTAKNNDSITIELEKYFPKTNKYFHIEINSITNKSSYLGTLILFKDTTQHILDIQTINDNQEILIEKERLATLGQMIGGIAHNLKTPIMSIAGAAEGLSDLVKEYRESLGDPEVTMEDHLEISKDMDEWLNKIRSHLSYMSDIITAVKGQAVTFSDSSSNGFTVEELLKNVDILMKHELKHSLIIMDVNVEVPKDTEVAGNVNSLVQVVNNIISNAIQAYSGKPYEHIFLDVYQKDKNLIIKIQDNAGGLPEKVKDKLFKEMITTKGKNGTGLGLFMSYSNIKAHFNGNLRYETASGIGTAFYIEIPLETE